jgi:hypothetical protein
LYEWGNQVHIHICGSASAQSSGKYQKGDHADQSTHTHYHNMWWAQCLQPGLHKEAPFLRKVCPTCTLFSPLLFWSNSNSHFPFQVEGSSLPILPAVLSDNMEQMRLCSGVILGCQGPSTPQKVSKAKARPALDLPALTPPAARTWLLSPPDYIS